MCRAPAQALPKFEIAEARARARLRMRRQGDSQKAADLHLAERIVAERHSDLLIQTGEHPAEQCKLG